LVGADVECFSFLWTFGVIGSVLAGLGFHLGLVLGFSGLVKLEFTALILCHFLMRSRVPVEWLDELESIELALLPSKSFLSLVVVSLLANSISVPPREEAESFIFFLP
jgi:hypothetical protein